MVSSFQKSIIWLLIALLAFEQAFFPVLSAKALEGGVVTEMEADIPFVDEEDGYSEGYSDDQPISATGKMFGTLSDASGSGLFNYNNVFVTFRSNPRLVFGQDDLQAIKSLFCLGRIMPDFENDFVTMFTYLPQTEGISSADDLQRLKFSDPARFNQLATKAKSNWGKSTSIKEAIFNDNATLECITSLSPELVAEYKLNNPDFIKAYIDDAVESLIIDIRVLRTLIYLVTPKDQGGAGHYRIKVSRLRSGYTSKARQYSRESDAIMARNRNLEDSANDSTDGMTAAEIGMTRDPEPTEDGSLVTATVTDENGDEYEAYMEEAQRNEDVALANINKEKNISAHAEGRAIDISEVDDIRCTLIKKRRVGSTKRTAQPARPIKLAWQTNEGYSESGGNPTDVAGIIRQAAADEVRDLVSEFGGDISDYEGDLSQSDFSDIVQLIGKSLMSYVLNSPSANLSGYDFTSTMENLGAMYFADALGLPRKAIIGRNINSLDDLKTVIGESAIELKLGLPYGSLAGNTLDSNLISIGQTKIEYEMNLNPGSLSQMYGDGERSSEGETVVPSVVGQASIEKALNLEPGSFQGRTYSDIKRNIGKYKADVVFMDPYFVDTELHLNPGTTDQLRKGTISPTQFITLVGEIRLNDTAYGFNYLRAHDSAYQLPDGTWEDALAGNAESLRVIGVDLIAKAFATNDEQRTALRTIILANTGNNDCVIPERMEVDIVVGGETKRVVISENKALEMGLARGDMSRLFGCTTANASAVFSRVGGRILYYALANSALNDERVMLNITDTTPDLRIPDNELGFYLERVERISEISDRIKTNWDDLRSDPNYQDITATIDEIVDIVGNDGFRFSKEAMQGTARRISMKVDYLHAQMRYRDENAGEDFRNKVDGTLRDVNELIRLCTELLEGQPVYTSDVLTLDQISRGALQIPGVNSGGFSSRSSQTTPLSIFKLISGRVNPKDFFISVAAEMVEGELSLPSNSIMYYIQNSEKKGLSGKDAFFMAIGQARIEQEFGMPDYYFQGPVYTMPNMPDYRNDIIALMRANGMTGTDEELKNRSFVYYETRRISPQTFNQWVVDAENRFKAEAARQKADLERRGGNGGLEVNARSVVENIEAKDLADGIRSADKDLLFRMGLTGTLSALEGGSYLAWATADQRATEIDRKLGLAPGSTKGFITGGRIQAADPRSILSTDEKEILSGKLLISEVAINKFIESLNGTLSLSDLQNSGGGIYYNGSNTYAPSAPDNASCPLSFTSQGGIMVANGIFENNSYVYIDADGPHSFPSRREAERYSQMHADKRIDFLTEIAAGLARATNKNADALRNDLEAYLQRTKSSVLTEAEMASSETSSDLPEGILSKLFTHETFTLTDKPLQSYKRTVGQAYAKQVVTWKLFEGLGIELDPDLFSANDLYDILNGNYKVLYKIGSSMIDRKLSLPTGTTMGLISGKTPSFRNCSLYDAGASMLGSLIGLPYLDVRGNVWLNAGSARIEQVLNLSRYSFRGRNMDELLTNAGAINVAIAFKLPVEGIVTNEMLYKMFDPKYVDANYSRLPEFEKLKIMKNYAETTPSISGEVLAAIASIEAAIRAKLVELADPAKPYWQDGYDINSDAKIRIFLENLEFLDQIFGLTLGTTEALFLGRSVQAEDRDGRVNDDGTVTPIIHGQYSDPVWVLMTPDQYRSAVAKRVVGNIALSSLADALGLSTEQANGIRNTISNFSIWMDNGEYGSLFDALQQTFNFNLDEQAGFTSGTFRAIIENPQDAALILLGEGARILDQRMGVESGAGGTFYRIYGGYRSDVSNCKDSWGSGIDYHNNQTSDIAAEIYSHSNDPNYSADAMRADLTRLNESERSTETFRQEYSACKAEARKDSLTIAGQALVDIYRERLASELVNKVRELTDGTINMPIEDMRKLTFEGDLRYLEAATIAYGANFVIDEIGGRRQVPANMQITYEDIMLAIIPDAPIGDYGGDAAAWGYFSSVDASGEDSATGDPAMSSTRDVSAVDYYWGDACGSGAMGASGVVNDCYGSDTFWETQASIGRSYPNLAQGNTNVMNARYGYDPSRQGDLQARMNQVNQWHDQCNVSQGATNDGEYSCAQVDAQWNNMREARERGSREARDIQREALQYRMLDAVAWKLDGNVFPGFTHAMMKGSAKTKQFALSVYLKNAITRGEIFGQRFGPGLPDFENWMKVVNFANNMHDPGAFDAFADGGGLTFLSNYIGSHSQKWFGFSMPDGAVESIMLGLSTGEWGWGEIENSYRTAGGREIPTLKEVGKGEITRRVFAWADKHLGLDAGTSYTAYKQYRTVVDARKMVNALSLTNMGSIDALANASGRVKDAMIKAYNSTLEAGAQRITSVDQISPDKLAGTREVAQKSASLQQAQANADAIAFVVNLVFAKQIGQAEEALGLVPGTGAMAVTMLVQWTMGVPVDPITIALFIVMNLFGYYKTELKCTADGYYPGKESPPSSSVADVSGLGVWDGLNSETNKQKSIAAAQYKAKRLLGDILKMQENPYYADIIPSQIMTGRQNDIDYWDTIIQNNICGKIGTTSVSGVCYAGRDKTLAGVWANPQTVAFTHIGF